MSAIICLFGIDFDDSKAIMKRASGSALVDSLRCPYSSEFLTPSFRQNGVMEMLGTILLIVVVVLIVGAVPTWSHSRGWGYYPVGVLGLVLVIVVVLLLIGRI